MQTRIYAFGDSLVAGTYDLQGGWCDRLKQDMHRMTNDAADGSKYQVYNLGIGGETSRGLAARITAELAARNRADWPAIVLIATGCNDSRTVNGEPEVPLKEYKANLIAIISAAREVTDSIILIGLGPCADKELPYKSVAYSQERLATYDAALTEVASQLAVPKVDVYEQLLNAGEAMFYRDRLHYSDAGYELVYQLVKPVVLRALAS